MDKPCIGYVRLSTQEQAQTNALKNQEERLRDAGAVEIYCDIESGADPARPNFDKMLRLVGQGKVERVIATRWDRLTRDAATYEVLKKTFRESNVELYLTDQGLVDLQTAAGELYSDMQAIYAIHERRSLIERVKKGFQKRRDRGAAWAKAPWGYTVVGERYQPDSTPIGWCHLNHRPDNYLDLYAEPEASAHLVQTTKAQFAREVFEEVLATRSPAKTLNYLRRTYNFQRNSELLPPQLKDFPISEQGFKSWLDNPIFCGHTAYLKTGDSSTHTKRSQRQARTEWDVRPNTHEAILSEEIAEEIQDILSTNRKKQTPSGKTSYLTGLIFCSSCTMKCTFRRSAGQKYYGCQHASTTCDNRGNVSLAKIDQAIIRALTRKAWRIAQEGSAQPDRLVELEKQYQQLTAISHWDTNSNLKEAAEDLRQKIEAVSSQTDVLCQRMLSHPQARKINFWYTLTQEERLIFYEKLVCRVETQGREVSAVILNI